MVDLLFVALFQTAVGTPEPPPASEPAPVAAPAQQTAQNDATAEDGRRCRARRVTGTRLSSLVTCGRGNGRQTQDTRDAMHDLQRPSGLQGS